MVCLQFQTNKGTVLDLPPEDEDQAAAESPAAKSTVDRGDVINFQGSPKADDLDKDKDIGEYLMKGVHAKLVSLVCSFDGVARCITRQ